MSRSLNMLTIARGTLTALALLAAAAVPAAARQLVVTSSTVADFHAGQILDGDQALSLPSGAALTLIGPDGKAVSLHGPYSGRPGQGGSSADPALVTKLAKLLDTRDADSNAIGAVRNGPGPAEPSDPWMINVGTSGVTCITNGAALVLWRADAGRDSRVFLRQAGAGGSAAINWPAGSATIPWPENLPVVPEEKYLVRVPGGSLPKVVQLRQVPADLPTKAHRAVWMSENGCPDQARRLLTSQP